MNADSKQLHVGDEIEVGILDAGEGNQAFCRLENGMGAFLRGVHVPGDLVRARVAKVKKRHAELSFLDLLQPSPHRIDPPCPYFGRCGGCRWQQVQYEQQLLIKQKTVQDALQRLGGFRDLEVEPAVAAPQGYGYRNKVDLVFSSVRSDSPSPGNWNLGFHVQGVSNAVLDIKAGCHLISPVMNRAAAAVRTVLQKQTWHAFDLKAGSGLLRSLMIRESAHTGQVMVNLVTTGPLPKQEWFLQELLQAEPDLHTAVNSIARQSNRIVVDECIALYGPGWIEEHFCGLSYQVSAASFLQPHTLQAEVLYREAVEQSGIRREDRVTDLYCGIGTLSLLLAQQAGSVVGIESVGDAVQDARSNAARNGLKNVTFRRSILGKDADLPKDTDVVMTDPPRSGMQPEVVEALARSGARRIVYISCHPASLARDARRLCEKGEYRLVSAKPFDLFPQTAHIETLAVFDRVS